VTQTQTRSASQFATGDVPVPERPTTQIQIGSRSYTARAPKTDVYREAMTIISKIDYAKALNKAREDGDLDEQEARELDSLALELADYDTTLQAIVTGQDMVDPQGRVVLRGGWLRRCLSREDWDAVWAEWHDDDSDIDADYLIGVATQLQDVFQPWFEAKMAAVGLPVVPKPTRKRAGRKPMQAARK
jgi:hypothetical protein